MRHFNFRNEMNALNYHRKTLNVFSKQAETIIRKLHAEFNQPSIDIITTEINNNSVEFMFFGFAIIIKTEIKFDSEKKGFVQGELNAYFINKDDLNLLLTYPFDSIGNIGNGAVLEDFSAFYYIDLISNIINFSSNNGIKFKL